MFSVTSFLAVALAGGASAFTPSGFTPASTNNLTVAYGSKLAMNGIQVLRADTSRAPILGTTTKMTGSYTVMMVDPDIPPAKSGGDTSQFLHWMQTDLTSANTTTTIGGQKVYELINVKNTSAFATYLQPNPPNIAPTTHRYTQLLFNTTNMNMSLTTLQTSGKARGNFSSADVVKRAKLMVLMGNSFDVSFGDKAMNTTGATTGTSTGNSTKPTSTGTATSTSNSSSISNSTSSTTGLAQSTGGAAGVRSGDGVLLAGLGAIAAAVVLL
ncbi:hypothetical protein SBOR_9858 [Sclerotinia borealis F-4128]|uniref:Phosphatidylethanolamine-binding protein PEBP n=1 Tax=Sclerotinia borealis (strain F-4128) TaxID=1432307 RepID=W9C212_SCLBF|nr:hypothetical protein SBOR_9858 [Sclerotinia borealis F-4128]